MTPAHQLDLVCRYPQLFRLADAPPLVTNRCFSREGFTIGDGWFSIVDSLSRKLAEDANLVVVQVKEKFGTLRFYVEDDSNSKSGRLSTKISVHMRLLDFAPWPANSHLAAAMAKAQRQSACTCEICGKSGMLERTKRGWLLVRCTPCLWLDEMEESCRRLEQITETARHGIPRLRARSTRRSAFAAFAADDVLPDACRRHLQHLGEAASHQSPEQRALLPLIDWPKLDLLRSVAAVQAMDVKKLWTVVRDEIPAVATALR